LCILGAGELLGGGLTSLPFFLVVALYSEGPGIFFGGLTNQPHNKYPFIVLVMDSNFHPDPEMRGARKTYREEKRKIRKEKSKTDQLDPRLELSDHRPLDTRPVETLSMIVH